MTSPNLTASWHIPGNNNTVAAYGQPAVEDDVRQLELIVAGLSARLTVYRYGEALKRLGES